MKNLVLEEKDKLAIESIIEKLANDHGITNVKSVSLDLNPESGLVKFAVDKTAFLGLAIPALAGLLYSLGSDPQVDEIITKIVDKVVQEDPSLFSTDADKKQYIGVLKDLINNGVRSYVEQLQQQEAQQNPNVQTRGRVTPKETVQQEMPAEYATGGLAELKKPQAAISDLDRSKEANVFESLGNWTSDVGENIVNKITSLFQSQSSFELVDQLVQLLIKKGRLPEQYAPEFTDHINKIIDNGFKQITTEVAAKKEEEKKNGTGQTQQAAKPAQPAQQQQAQPAQKGTSAETAFQGLTPEQHAEWAKKYPALAAANPPPTVETQSSTQDYDMDAQGNMIKRNSFESNREKTADYYMERLLQSDPLSYEIVESYFIKSGSYGEDRVVTAAMLDKVLSMLESIYNFGLKVTGPEVTDKLDYVSNYVKSNPDAINFIVKLFNIKNKEELLEKIPAIVDKVSNLIKGFHGVFSGNQPEKHQDTETAPISPVENEQIKKEESIPTEEKPAEGIEETLNIQPMDESGFLPVEIQQDFDENYSVPTVEQLVEREPEKPVKEKKKIKVPKKEQKEEKKETSKETPKEEIKGEEESPGDFSAIMEEEPFVEEESTKEQKSEEPKEAPKEAPKEEVESKVNKAVEKQTYSLADSIRKRMQEAGVGKLAYVQLNSDTFIIRRGSSIYEEIESEIEKIAEFYNIDSIQETQLELTENSSDIMFSDRKSFDLGGKNPSLSPSLSDPSLLSGALAAAAGRFMGGDESLGATAIKGGAAAFGGWPMILGQILGKALGMGTVGQLITGGLGMMAYFMFTNKDDPKIKKVNAEAVEAAKTDPGMSQLMAAFKKEAPNTPDSVLMTHATEMMAKLKALKDMPAAK